LIRELKLNMHASAAAYWRAPIGFTKAKRRPVGWIPHHMSRSVYCSLQEFPGPALFTIFSVMRSLTMLEKGLKRPAKICLRSVFPQLLILHFSFGLAYGAAYPGQGQEQRQALGSLTTTGEVYLNSSGAPTQSTVLAGDVLRTSPGGTAMFTLAGNGSLRISPNTEIVFAGGPQYAAELKLGKVVMNSLNGPMGITLRAGSSVVVAVAEGEQSTSSIEAPSDGSFLISCLGGSVGVIPLQGGKGIFIREGQSVSVSPQGELSAMSAQVAPLAAQGATDTETAPAARQKHSHARWILIGVGAAGAVTAAAILSARGSGASVNTPTVAAASGSATPPASNPPTPDPPAPPQPTPPQPTPPQPQPPPPQPPPQPNPPGGDGCHHRKNNCQPNVVIGFAFHF
jgi:hypothetical protein